MSWCCTNSNLLIICLSSVPGKYHKRLIKRAYVRYNGILALSNRDCKHVQKTHTNNHLAIATKTWKIGLKQKPMSTSGTFWSLSCTSKSTRPLSESENKFVVTKSHWYGGFWELIFAGLLNFTNCACGSWMWLLKNWSTKGVTSRYFEP